MQRVGLISLDAPTSTTVWVPTECVIKVGPTEGCDIVVRGSSPGKKGVAVTLARVKKAEGGMASDGPLLTMKMSASAHVMVNGIRTLACRPVTLRADDVVVFGLPNTANTAAFRIVVEDTTITQQQRPPLGTRRLTPPPSPAGHHMDPNSRGTSPLLLRRSPLRVPRPTVQHKQEPEVIPQPPPHAIAPWYLCCGPNGTVEHLPTRPHFPEGSDQLLTIRGAAAMAPTVPYEVPLAQRMLDHLNTHYDSTKQAFTPLISHRDMLRTYSIAIVEQATRLFTSEPPLLHVTSPVWCCGDLHGSIEDLMHVMHSCLPFGQVAYQPCPFVFLGDYVDRGDHSVEVVLMLFAWKVLNPTSTVLLRGNHEDPEVNGDTDQYGSGSFQQRCIALLGADVGGQYWTAVNHAFSMLPVAAVVDRSVFLCHGGVPHMGRLGRTVTSAHRLEDTLQRLMDQAARYTKVRGPVTLISKLSSLMPDANDPEAMALLRQLLREIVWNDPSPSSTDQSCATGASTTCIGGGGAVSQTTSATESTTFDDEGFRCNIGRGDADHVIHEFSHAAVERFLLTNQWSLIIRAHQHKANGAEVSSIGRVITLFTSCNYANANAAGACYIHNNLVNLVSWRREHHSPQRSATVVLEAPPLMWSCGQLPSSVHFTLHGGGTCATSTCRMATPTAPQEGRRPGALTPTPASTPNDSRDGSPTLRKQEAVFG